MSLVRSKHSIRSLAVPLLYSLKAAVRDPGLAQTGERSVPLTIYLFSAFERKGKHIGSDPWPCERRGHRRRRRSLDQAELLQPIQSNLRQRTRPLIAGGELRGIPQWMISVVERSAIVIGNEHFEKACDERVENEDDRTPDVHLFGGDDDELCESRTRK